MTVRARYDDNSRAVDRKVRKATKEWREEVAVMAALEMLRYVPVDTGETEAQPYMRQPVYDRSFHRRALARW